MTSSIPKYLAFDFDGTLADTNTGILLTYKAMFKELGRPAPSDETLSGMIGITIPDALPLLCPGISAEEVELGFKTYHSLFPTIAIPTVKAFPGIVDMLRAIKERGYRLVVTTSRSHKTLENLAAQIGVAPFFEAMFGTEDVERCKPYPDLAIKALSHYDIAPQDMLVIGDASFDILMAKGALCPCCAVTWGNQKRERLMAEKPEFIVDSPAELIALL